MVDTLNIEFIDGDRTVDGTLLNLMVRKINELVAGGGGGGSVSVEINEIPDLPAVLSGDAQTFPAFNVTGVVGITAVFGIVGTAVGSAADATTLSVVPSAVGAAFSFLNGVTVDGSILTEGAVWSNDGSNASEAGAYATEDVFILSGGTIDLTAGDADITQGSLTLYVLWEPISSGATVEAT